MDWKQEAKTVIDSDRFSPGTPAFLMARGPPVDLSTDG